MSTWGRTKYIQILVTNLHGMTPLGRPRWEDNVKTYLTETACEDVNLNEMAHE
jgi:hypothetical protein